MHQKVLDRIRAMNTTTAHLEELKQELEDLGWIPLQYPTGEWTAVGILERNCESCVFNDDSIVDGSPCLLCCNMAANRTINMHQFE